MSGSDTIRASGSDEVAERVDLVLALGVCELGNMVASILLGVYLLQVFTYFRTYRNTDPYLLRLTIAILTVLNVVHLGTLYYDFWFHTVTHFSDISVIELSTKPLAVAILLSGLIPFIVQCIFCHRIWIFTRKHLSVAICFMLIIIRFVFNMITAAESMHLPYLQNVQNKFNWAVIGSVCSGAVSDLLVAGVLVMALHNSKSCSGAMNDVVGVIIYYTMTTGVLTSIISVVQLVCFLALNNLIWLAVYLVLPKVFCCSLMVALNSRSSLRHHLNSTDPTLTTMTVKFHHGPQRSQPPRVGQSWLGVAETKSDSFSMWSLDHTANTSHTDLSKC